VEQHLIHIEVLDTATSQCRKRGGKINKEKDGELERREEKQEGQKVNQTRQNETKPTTEDKKQKSFVN